MCPNTCWGGYTAAYGGELVNWVGTRRDCNLDRSSDTLVND